MNSTEAVTKDIIVAWLNNSHTTQETGSFPAGKDAAQVGEFIATVYKTVFRTVEETTRAATEHGRAARRDS